MSNLKIANHKYIYEFKSLALKICIFSNFLYYKNNIAYVKSQYFCYGNNVSNMQCSKASATNILKTNFIFRHYKI